MELCWSDIFEEKLHAACWCPMSALTFGATFLFLALKRLSLGRILQVTNLAECCPCSLACWATNLSMSADWVLSVKYRGLLACLAKYRDLLACFAMLHVESTALASSAKHLAESPMMVSWKRLCHSAELFGELSVSFA